MGDEKSKKWPPEDVTPETVGRIIDKLRSPTPQEVAETTINKAEERVKRARERQARLQRLRESDPEMVDLIERL